MSRGAGLYFLRNVQPKIEHEPKASYIEPISPPACNWRGVRHQGSRWYILIGPQHNSQEDISRKTCFAKKKLPQRFLILAQVYSWKVGAVELPLAGCPSPKDA